MGATRRGTAVAADAHGGGTAGEHVLNAQACPGSDVVVEFFEEFIPAIIDGEVKFGRMAPAIRSTSGGSELM